MSTIHIADGVRSAGMLVPDPHNYGRARPRRYHALMPWCLRLHPRFRIGELVTFGSLARNQSVQFPRQYRGLNVYGYGNGIEDGLRLW